MPTLRFCSYGRDSKSSMKLDCAANLTTNFGHVSSRAIYPYTKHFKALNKFTNPLKPLHISVSGFEFTVGTMSTDIHLFTQDYLEWRFRLSTQRLLEEWRCQWLHFDLHYVETVPNGQLNNIFAN